MSLISFEGIECSGKSTQIKLFRNYLESIGKKVFLFREPGTTSLGEKVRHILLEDQQESLGPTAELFLFLAARAHLIETEIRPKLKEENTIIILDRFIDSSIAYQGAGKGLGIKEVLELHKKMPGLNTMPDLTFYLQLSKEESAKRMSTRDEKKDKMEKLDQTFFSKVFNAYEEISKSEERIKIIDASPSKEKVHQQIVEIFKKLKT